jgi:hypothetical protein
MHRVLCSDRQSSPHLQLGHELLFFGDVPAKQPDAAACGARVLQLVTQLARLLLRL